MDAEIKKKTNALRRKYRKAIPDLELSSCINDGIMLANANYNKDKSNGKTFEQYVYERINWQCLRWLKKERKAKFIPAKSESRHDSQILVISDSFNEMIEGLTDEDKEILRLRFVEQLNLTEIGNIYGFSHETARKKINKALLILRKDYV